MGRPKLVLDENQIVQLAAINCSLAEMAAVLDCDAKTLTSRFSSVIEKGRNTGKMSLKRKQWEVAMGGNVTMLIWLGKQNLGQTDKVEKWIETTSGSEAELLKLREQAKASLGERKG